MKRVEKAVDYVLLEVSSPSFKEGGMIPPVFTCDGRNINPAIDINNIPEEAKCLALVVDDPDAPPGHMGTLDSVEYSCNPSYSRR